MNVMILAAMVSGQHVLLVNHRLTERLQHDGKDPGNHQATVMPTHPVVRKVDNARQDGQHWTAGRRRMMDTTAKETCAYCGRELWHAPGGWKHLITSRERCEGGGQAGSARVATPRRRLYR